MCRVVPVPVATVVEPGLSYGPIGLTQPSRGDGTWLAAAITLYRASRDADHLQQPWFVAEFFASWSQMAVQGAETATNDPMASLRRAAGAQGLCLLVVRPSSGCSKTSSQAVSQASVIYRYSLLVGKRSRDSSLGVPRQATKHHGDLNLWVSDGAETVRIELGWVCLPILRLLALCTEKPLRSRCGAHTVTIELPGTQSQVPTDTIFRMKADIADNDRWAKNRSPMRIGFDAREVTTGRYGDIFPNLPTLRGFGAEVVVFCADDQEAYPGPIRSLVSVSTDPLAALGRGLRH